MRAARHLTMALIVALACSLAQGAGPDPQLRNFGRPLELRETETPPGQRSSPVLRFFRTADGQTLALANRVLVTTDSAAARAAVLALGSWRERRTLAAWDEVRIESLETADVAEALARAEAVAGIPGVRSAQPDMAQNVLPPTPWPARDGTTSPRLDWRRFDLAAALGLREAWRFGHGRGVRVAIIDAGIDLGHPDLRGTRLLAGRDVDSGAAAFAPEGPGESHGTRVAGLIFARHNGIGIDGIAPAAGLIALRLRSGWTSRLLLALQAAAEARADVINCSWTLPLMPEPVAHLIDHLAAHGREGRGTVLVVAAGNRPQELRGPEEAGGPEAFAAHPALLAVTAVDHDGAPYGAAYGPAVFIAAPGMVKTTGPHFDGYEPLAATSAAAAIVSGVAALMLAANPRLEAARLRQILADTAGRGADAKRAGRSPDLGAGRLHAARAVAAASASANTFSGTP